MLSDVHQRPKTYVPEVFVYGFKFILQDFSDKYRNPYRTSKTYSSLIFFQCVSVQSDWRLLQFHTALLPTT